ncbi:cobyric acid synthase [Natrialbaceae archaeon AArc-T1-2]|uniref:cobyric acid synthase n=1 Tax=Natrialbaceae archaeon AArc-T1-2 TaxID=3053904 RepID=UPI00255A9454|nr:cobyric acid synthase [Natrialbaceae archaeon AArc-T1-2]WIV67574.1 cobyric acid synthase [Natrialbaceae archaeon AArc-T1-2]
MTRTILVAGTASHVGKSTIAAGLCRLLADRGVDVAPYKAQNMSNNARVVARADEGGDGDDGDDGDAWGEIGVSQFVQARAAGVTPTTDANPVLLKPRGDGESQFVLQGRAIDHFPAGEYYERHWERARAAAERSHRRLARDHDVIIAEGAGSIAEINLHERDLANVETARFGDAEILLLVDIERGGAFASLYGTIELLPEDLRERIVGAVVTKFRGDPSLLEPGIDEIEARTGVPILGVVPYDDPGLPEEDSVSLPATDQRRVDGDDDGIDPAHSVTIAVPRLPRLSNATDLEALAAVAGVRVAYVPVDGDVDEPLAEADAVVLPGTKNTVDDLLALRAAGFADALERFDGPVVGICGGYQLLGERITNAALEGTGDREVVPGFGLLPVETAFGEEKRLEQVTVEVSGAGPIAGARGTVSGYEIHAGRTRVLADLPSPLDPDSAVRETVLGTYLHGLFDEDPVREAFLDCVYREAGRERPPTDDVGEATSPYDRAASLVRDHVDLEALGEPFL